MKKKKIIFLLLTISLNVNSYVGYSQQNKNSSLTIQTSGHCGECKKTIEKALTFEKGVKDVQFDATNGLVHVEYNSAKTDPTRLRKAITLVGYDADSLLADPKAYNRLKECCKKENKHYMQH